MQPNEPQQVPVPQQPQEYPAPVPPSQPVQPMPQPTSAMPPAEHPQPDPTQAQQYVAPIEPQLASLPVQPVVEIEQPQALAPQEPMPPVQHTQPQQPAYQPPAADAPLAEQPQPFAPSPAAARVQQSPAPLQPAPGDPGQYPDGYEDNDQPSELPSVVPVTWQAKEYLQHDKTPVWYVGFGVIVLVLMGLAVWLQAWTFAVLVPIMAAALAVYAHRPPRVVSYTVSDKGLTINDQLHPMGEFKSFGVLPDNELHALMLVPVKRFRPGVTLYFPDEVGEQLVDTLGAFLPMQDLHVDMVDKVIRKLRI